MTSKTPITVRYQETAFTFPWSDNRQAIHDHVYQVLLNGEHVPNDQKTRLFLYDAAPLDPDGELGLVTARSMAFRPGIPGDEKTLVVQAGKALTIDLTVSGSRQTRREHNGREIRGYARVPDNELNDWLTAMLSRNGMTASSFKVRDRSEYEVRKAKTAFGVSSVKVRAEVVVDDAVQFTKAFLNGIGRQKGYGFGLMEVVSS